MIRYPEEVKRRAIELANGKRSSGQIARMCVANTKMKKPSRHTIVKWIRGAGCELPKRNLYGEEVIRYAKVLYCNSTLTITGISNQINHRFGKRPTQSAINGWASKRGWKRPADYINRDITDVPFLLRLMVVKYVKLGLDIDTALRRGLSDYSKFDSNFDMDISSKDVELWVKKMK